MATVRLLDAQQAPLLARQYFADGDPGPIVGALAQVPELIGPTLSFVNAALGPSAISWREKELVIVRTSALLECAYCVATHTAVAMDAGLSRAEILALRGQSAIAAVFTAPRELALLEWVDVLARGRGPVPGQVTERLRAEWEDHEIVELTMVVGATMTLNRMATALELPVAEETARRLGSEGLLAGPDQAGPEGLR